MRTRGSTTGAALVRSSCRGQPLLNLAQLCLVVVVSAFVREQSLASDRSVRLGVRTLAGARIGSRLGVGHTKLARRSGG